MRTRDMYATLLELVPTLLARREGLITGWSAQADPVWRRGDYWVRVEAPTTFQLLVKAGHGDTIDVERVHIVGGPLQTVAEDIASLLNGADAAS
ncbi:MAG TPA: hypothetical protein VFE70_02230 [Candidatus Elarobacter sp.]|nr:hypothetical protein [Candidatus Elarobacter sp.]